MFLLCLFFSGYQRSISHTERLGLPSNMPRKHRSEGQREHGDLLPGRTKQDQRHREPSWRRQFFNHSPPQRQRQVNQFKSERVGHDFGKGLMEAKRFVEDVPNPSVNWQ